MRITRRQTIVGLSALTAACVPTPPAHAQTAPLPIVFVHGNGDTAGLWITTLWRFESNGYPADRLHAIDLKYPQARANNDVAQAGRSSANDVMTQLAEYVMAVKASTGADKVILVANSRGGNTVRNYLKNGGGAAHASLAILCGAVNHGVINSGTALAGSEFNGDSAFMRDLNGTPGEVVAGVRFVTIRSADNDKFAQPDGRHLGMPGVATGIGFDGPELKGAENIVIPRIDHRETAFGPEAFAEIYHAITGKAPARTTVAEAAVPVLNGKVTGFEAGVPSNIGVLGATVSIYRVEPETGQRQGEAVHLGITNADGLWGPFITTADAFHEFVVEAPGYPITHIYRSPFLRVSAIVHLRPQVLGKDDAAADAVVYISRPRGYFGEGRGDIVELGGKPAAGIPPGVATVATSRLVVAGSAQQAIPGRFNGERITARSWPMKENRVSVIELTW